MGTEVISIRKTESLLDTIQKTNDRITRRAYEIFKDNGSVLGRDLDHWLMAERELVWKPPIEVNERDGELYINVAMAGMQPKDLEIEITPDDLLVRGDVRREHNESTGTVHTCEFVSGSLFRAIHFPKRVDPNKAKAEFQNGMLYLKTPVAEEQRTRKTTAEAA
jgi:HSP20 family protein